MTNQTVKDLLSAPELLSLPHLGLLHYLLSESDGEHVAHCLDLDLVAVGDNSQKAAEKLDTLVKAHIELALATGQYANLVTRAPQSFWNQFADGKPIKLEPSRLHIRIPESVQIVPVADSELRILAHAA
jgi:hypothetical protein